MGIVVHGDIRRVHKVLDRYFPFLIREFVNDEAEVLVRHIRSFTPVKTGHLWESVEPIPVRHRPGSKIWRAGAKSEVEYASFVEDGTLPHWIHAHGQALRFFWRGVPRYAPRVFHPGTPAHNMFAKGAFVYERGIRVRFENPFRQFKIKHRL